MAPAADARRTAKPCVLESRHCVRSPRAASPTESGRSGGVSGATGSGRARARARARRRRAQTPAHPSRRTATGATTAARRSGPARLAARAQVGPSHTSRRARTPTGGATASTRIACARLTSKRVTPRLAPGTDRRRTPSSDGSSARGARPLLLKLAAASSRRPRSVCTPRRRSSRRASPSTRSSATSEASSKSPSLEKGGTGARRSPSRPNPPSRAPLTTLALLPRPTAGWR